MTGDSIGLFEILLLMLAGAEDALVNSYPLIVLSAGALALSIGVIAWPINPQPKKGNDRGVL